ncbi:MAG: class I SAM-dependent methyltransferase [Rhodospirillales bacterium]|nr:class I SAM-dependent methyltransferase [Rhodospirillales bacterium]
MTGGENDLDARRHWQGIHQKKSAPSVSWYQDTPRTSLNLIHETGLGQAAAIVDVGGGASTLVDHLLAEGFTRLSVLDIASAGLEQARARLGAKADKVLWLTEDATAWRPGPTFDLWHDRAVFHFLTDPSDRAGYRAALGNALRPGGWVIVATFALDGPEKCSGLPVVHYSSETLSAELGPDFALIEARSEVHLTPGGAPQSFVYGLFRAV